MEIRMILLQCKDVAGVFSRMRVAMAFWQPMASMVTMQATTAEKLWLQEAALNCPDQLAMPDVPRKTARNHSGSGLLSLD